MNASRYVKKGCPVCKMPAGRPCRNLETGRVSSVMHRERLK